MTADSTLMLQGPVLVHLGGVELGYTAGSVQVKVTRPMQGVGGVEYATPYVWYTDQGGVEITGALAEFAPERLRQLLPEAVLSGDTLRYGRTPGHRFDDEALPLTLHPVRNGADTARDVHVYRALSVGPELSWDYTARQVRTVPFHFIGLPDTGRSDGEQLFDIGVTGDSSAPTRSSTSPADGAELVGVDTEIVVVFSDSMARHTLIDDGGRPVNALLFDRTDGDFIACTGQLSSTSSTNDTLTLTPQAPLNVDYTYYVLINDAVRDRAGNAHPGSSTKFSTNTE